MYSWISYQVFKAAAWKILLKINCGYVNPNINFGSASYHTPCNDDDDDDDRGIGGDGDDGIMSIVYANQMIVANGAMQYITGFYKTYSVNRLFITILYSLKRALDVMIPFHSWAEGPRNPTFFSIECHAPFFSNFF